MTTLIGYQTALELWRRPEIYLHARFADPMTVTAQIEVDQDPWTVEGTTSTIWPDTLIHLAKPWHLISSHYGHHVGQNGIHWHSRTLPLPPRSGLRLDGDVFVVSPELCLLQMAEVLPIVPLIELMDEFCGTYTLEDDGLASRPPLTSTALIARYLDSSEGVRGVKAARRALSHAVDRSASPKETHAEMLFSLPVALGGKGLPKPQMNQRFDVPPERRQPHDSSYLECDICWTSSAAASADQVRHNAVEYQSTAWHVGAEKLAADSRRRNLLESMGVHVITLTAAEFYSQRGFDRVARLVAEGIGVHVRTRLSPEEVKRREAGLRQMLLGPKRAQANQNQVDTAWADAPWDEDDLPPDQR